MKVKSGGGGIDADGNWYTLPEIEHEIPDDAFEAALKKLFAEGSKPTHFHLSPAFAKMLRNQRD